MKARHVFGLLLGTLVLGASAGAGAAPDTHDAAPLEAQPHMRAALKTLKVARSQLVKATPDKGGHRVKAIALVTKAIAEVHKGISFDNAHSTSLDAAELEAQPHMKAALVTLNVAKNQLKKATPDKGGHRVKAIALVIKAIAEVKKGVAFDNAH